MDALLFAFALTAVAQAKPSTPEKVDIVAVAGCLSETSPGTWVLADAGDPVVSNANAPTPKELASIAKNGKNEFRLIGVTVFDLPAHRDHAVLVKGLLNKATPVHRLNITSLTMVAAECPAK